jgi:hypothetical protein
MGNNDLKEMDAGTMDPSGRSTTNAGRICGIIGTILMILGALLVLGILFLIIVASAAGA